MRGKLIQFFILFNAQDLQDVMKILMVICSKYNLLIENSTRIRSNYWNSYNVYIII